MVKIVKTRVEFEGRFREEYVAVEGEQLEPWSSAQRSTVVGKPVPRIDGLAKVNGSARYTHDIQLPGMVYGKFLRCPYGHARLKRIDASRAESMPGILAVYTHLSVSRLPFENASTLLKDELFYNGDEVALVVGDDEATVVDALEEIEVEYEQLPAVVDPEESISSDRVKISSEGNVAGGAPKVYQRGDIERGFRDADVVIEQSFKTQAALHNCMETHGSVAVWEGENLTVYTSTQSIFGVRESLARSLKVPERRIRVVSQYMGGGFGSKFGPGKYTVMAAMASKALGRPVRVVLDRVEENLATGNRSQTVQHVRIGAKKTGELTAIELKALVNTGVSGWAADPGGPYKMLYRCPNVRCEVYGVRTNTVSCTAFRAPGYVEGCFTLERAMDELAHKLGVDPLEFRLRNYAEQDQTMGLPYSSKELKRAYELGAKLIGWNTSPRVVRDGSKIRAKGMASVIWWGGGGPPAYAQVRVNSDGSATVVTGTQDIGTGTRTALAQIAAEELGVDVSTVSVVLGDTSNELYSPGSGGSGTLASVGPAVRGAAHDAKNQLIDIASQMLDVSKERLKLVDGAVQTEDGSVRLTVKDLMDRLGDFEVMGKGARGPNDDSYMVNTFAAQFAEVELDTETGRVDVVRLVSVHDSGRVINAKLISSQVLGGVVQGLGYALSEGRLVDKSSGVVVNPNLLDYLVPRCGDVNEVVAEFVEPDDFHSNTIAAKGIGEPPIIGVAPAIANAVRAALAQPVNELPLTQDRVYSLLHGSSPLITRGQVGYY